MSFIADLEGRVLDAQAGSGNHYHDDLHTQSVRDRMKELLDNLRLKATEEEREDADVAALFHDDGHSGTTIRTEAARELPCPDMINEEYACIRMRNNCIPYLSLERIVRIERMIMATTFGRVPHPHPAATTLEKLLVFADVGGFMNGPEQWMEESFNVLRETPVKQRPATFEQFRNVQTKYLLTYVQQKLDDVSGLLREKYAVTLQRRLNEVIGHVIGEDFDKHREQYELIMNE